MSTHRSRTKVSRRHGFTLIEACAIVAVLAVIVAVLVPMFRKAQRNLQHRSCSSNLKQIGLGIMQYTQDNDDRYPRTAIVNLTGSVSVHTLQSWRQGIYPYVQTKAIFQCPDADDGRGADSAIDGFPLSYDVTDCGPVRVDRTVRVKDVSTPADTIMVFEKDGDSPQGQQIGVLWDHDTGELGWTNILYSGHFYGSYYLFADGHVKWLQPMGTIAGGINRWHLNPHDPVSPRAMQKLKAAQRNFQD